MQTLWQFLALSTKNVVFLVKTNRNLRKMTIVYQFRIWSEVPNLKIFACRTRVLVNCSMVENFGLEVNVSNNEVLEARMVPFIKTKEEEIMSLQREAFRWLCDINSCWTVVIMTW